MLMMISSRHMHRSRRRRIAGLAGERSGLRRGRGVSGGLSAERSVRRFGSFPRRGCGKEMMAGTMA